VHEGDWLLGAILDRKAWQAVRSGQLSGFSPQAR
jgi:hypothetical protein